MSEENIADISGENPEAIVYDSFEDLGLKEQLLRGIYSYGFIKPSEIQAKVIKCITEKNDTIVQERFCHEIIGAHLIGVLQRIDYSLSECQVIILSSSYELARITDRTISEIGNYLKIETILCIGQCDIQESKKKIERGVHIAIGTPGRTLDMIRRKILPLKNIELLILREADELLSDSDINFRNQIKGIIGALSENVQICLLSTTTMPPDVLEVTKKFMVNPVTILS